LSGTYAEARQVKRSQSWFTMRGPRSRKIANLLPSDRALQARSSYRGAISSYLWSAPPPGLAGHHLVRHLPRVRHPALLTPCLRRGGRRVTEVHRRSGGLRPPVKGTNQARALNKVGKVGASSYLVPPRHRCRAVGGGLLPLLQFLGSCACLSVALSASTWELQK